MIFDEIDAIAERLIGDRTTSDADECDRIHWLVWKGIGSGLWGEELMAWAEEQIHNDD